IRVVRVKTYIAANEGFAGRTLDYLSFMAMGAAAGALERRPDVLVATSPQFFAGLGGAALGSLRRLPFVLEVRDLWPASIVAVGAMRGGPVIDALERLELALYRRADAVIVVTEAFRTDIAARGIAPEKLHLVPNGADLSWCAPRPRDTSLAREYGLEGKFVVGYIGTHGMAHGLERVLDAAERLRDANDIAFFFAGAGAERASLEQSVARRRLDNVRLIPRQPKARMSALWSVCDLTLIPLRADPVFATVIPSKLFEAMAHGVPIVIGTPEGEATALVRDTGAGVSVPPEDPEALAGAIVELQRAPERLGELRARALAAAPRFSRQHQAERMIDVLERVVRCGA
ncbi:MAG TPA: glycosyltransferase family 4 protein, partial [Polyangiaceae bacterium]|nr:glycosyltransferase family 4 protein [Polyangiaceae bacterium]